jgi:hypothetical protein
LTALRLVVAVMVAAVMAGGCGGGGGEGEALIGPGADGQWYEVGASTGVGELMSFGNVIALAPGVTEEATLQSVRLTGNNGLELVGVAVNGPGRRFAMVGSQRGFPVPELDNDRLPLPGAVLPTGDDQTRRRGLSLTFGVRKGTPGRGYSTGFEVAYTMGGKTWRQTFPTGMVVCAVPGLIVGQGDPPPPCESSPELRRNK